MRFSNRHHHFFESAPQGFSQRAGREGANRGDKREQTTPCRKSVAKSIAGKRDVEKGKVVRLQSGIDLEEAIETFAEQAGCDEEDYGGRELDDYEIRSKAAPVEAGRVASAFSEAIAHALATSR